MKDEKGETMSSEYTEFCVDNRDGITRYYTREKAEALERERATLCRDAKESYEKQIREQAEKIDCLLQGRVELRIQLDDKDAKIDSLLQENKEQRRTINELKAQLDDKDNTIKLLLKQFANRAWGLAREQIDELKAQIRDLKADHAKSETVRATAKVEYEKTINELKAQVADKDATIKTLQGVLVNRAEADARMTNTLADLKEKCRKRQSRIEELEEADKTYRQILYASGHRKVQLRATVRELESQVEQLQGTVAKTEDQLIKSFEQRARLQDSLEELRRENAELRCKLACSESFRP